MSNRPNPSQPLAWMQTEQPAPHPAERLCIPLQPHHVATFCLSAAGGGYTPRSTAEAMLFQRRVATSEGHYFSRLEAWLFTPRSVAPETPSREAAK